MEWLIDASAWVLPVVLAVTLHEAAHGWMAEKFGDDTARRLGRVTFNPLKHVDRLGTVVFPGLLLLAGSPLLFGYAKPVPVSFERLTPQRQGMFMVALAGPGINVLLAVASGLLLHIEMLVTPEQAPWLFMNLYRLLLINCVLAVFNLLPVLPLDGGRIVDSLLTGKVKQWFGRIEPYGVGIVIGVLFLSVWLELGLAETIVGVPTYWLMERVLWLTGHAAA